MVRAPWQTPPLSSQALESATLCWIVLCLGSSRTSWQPLSGAGPASCVCHQEQGIVGLWVCTVGHPMLDPAGTCGYVILRLFPPVETLLPSAANPSCFVLLSSPQILCVPSVASVLGSKGMAVPAGGAA